eukprot:scaffold212941_cov39-Tisochrysis_lutea.AAC.2
MNNPLRYACLAIFIVVAIVLALISVAAYLIGLSLSRSASLPEGLCLIHAVRRSAGLLHLGWLELI